MRKHPIPVVMACVALLLTWQQPSAAGSFLRNLARITGVSLPATQLKSADDSVESGDIWMVKLGNDTPAPVTADGHYRSPIFELDNLHLLAMEEGSLVRVSLQSGAVEKICNLEKCLKLVGVDKEDKDKVLILLDEAETGRVGLFSLKDKKMALIPYDIDSAEDARMLDHIRGWRRVYGDVTLFQKRENKETMAGPVEWTDLYLKVRGKKAVNVSRCDGASCGQGSLSHDGATVVFIRQE